MSFGHGLPGEGRIPRVPCLLEVFHRQGADGVKRAHVLGGPEVVVFLEQLGADRLLMKLAVKAAVAGLVGHRNSPFSHDHQCLEAFASENRPQAEPAEVPVAFRNHVGIAH